MAYVDGPLTAQSSAEPLFRRVRRVASLSPHQTEADTEPASSISEQHATAVRQDIAGQVNGQLETQAQSFHGQGSKFILAVDFGTTYSTVSYAKVDHGTDAATLGVTDIQCIDNYKKATGGHDARANSRVDNVPTEILYLGSATSTSDVSDSDSASDASTLRDTTPGDNGNHRQIRPARRKRGKKRSAKPSRNITQSRWTRPAGVSLKWGFSVQDMQKYPEDLQTYQESETVKLIKLSLGDEAEHLTDKRRELVEQIQRLQSRHFVRDRDHVLQDYLTRLLHHARCMLRREAGLQDHSELEFVLCVPVSWSESACRIMHDAMAKAIQNCRLEDLAQDVISSLFIVSEPEAAAHFVLASLGKKGRLRKDEVFIILDAGGGTVDITTYKVTSDGAGPLRLQGEMVQPDGALCGSSLISDRYAAELKIKLQAENLPDGVDIEARVTALTNNWDLYDKPGIDIDNNKYQRRRVFVHGGRIQWTREEIRALFEPSLKGVTDLLEKQLQLADAKGLTVSKLIVVGGFGESPSLRGRIEEVIATKRNIIGGPIVPIWPREFPTSAVARGAVLRALNKQDGPNRISRSSFGFLRHEQYTAYPEHKEAGVVPTRDSVDHYPNVKDTIYWVIQAVSETEPPRYLTPALTRTTSRAQSYRQDSNPSQSCPVTISHLTNRNSSASKSCTPLQETTAHISRITIQRMRVKPCSRPLRERLLANTIDQ
jgi:hypothetical protein